MRPAARGWKRSRRVTGGHLAGLGGEAVRFRVEDGGGVTLIDETPTGSVDQSRALDWLLGWLEARADPMPLRGIGHRIVHGGRDFAAPERLDDRVLARLAALTPLAPLHQPHGLAPVRLFTRRWPAVPQVACFDTAYHAKQPAVARSFALPRRLTDAGLIRYGFHGLSYDYLSRRLAQRLGRSATGRVVMAHLGQGASLCAALDGGSVASSMGFSTLDGLPMGTRCGYLDPGLVLHLLTQEGLSAERVGEILYRESGLLGVSGLSADMRVLLASDEAGAREAIELFVYRVVREIGALAATLGGLDHLVFSGGIGERASAVRAAIGAGCRWLGLELDAQTNARHEMTISAAGSRIGAWVIPTDEERMIAFYTRELIGADAED